MASSTQDSPKMTLASVTTVPVVELPVQGGRSRRTWLVRWLLAGGAVAVLAVATLAMLPHLTGFANSETASNALTAPITRSNLAVTVTENGDVESASNIDVKCRIPGGSTIVWIIKDGTTVSEG